MGDQSEITKAQKLSFNENGELQTNNTDNLTTTVADYSGAETDTTLITPASGEQIEVYDIFISTAVTNVNVEIKLGSTTIFKLYTTNFTASASPILHIEGAVDEVLSVTCGAGTFVAVTHHEH